MNQAKKSDWWSGSLLRLAGYAMLFLTILDLATIFFPLGFKDPLWEFQMVGALVERVPVPLLGLVIIFQDKATEREQTILTLLSRLSLVVGLLFILLVPLGLSATWRINNNNNLGLSTQVSQQLQQIQQRRTLLDKATPQELDAFFNQLSQRGNLNGVKSPQQLKTQLFAEFSRLEAQVRAQADERRADTRTNLLKNSVKWNIGALVSGIAFILVWKNTRKARPV